MEKLILIFWNQKTGDQWTEQIEIASHLVPVLANDFREIEKKPNMPKVSIYQIPRERY